MLYLDTSAFLKLVVEEEHSAALRATLRGADLWSSALLDVEAHRAGPRLDVPADVITEHLEAVTLVTVGEGTLAAARSVGVPALRTIDALHLAAALELGADLDAVVTYDRRLAAGCSAESCAVVGPGLAARWWEPSR